jgi:predicted secreted protein
MTIAPLPPGSQLAGLRRATRRCTIAALLAGLAATSSHVLAQTVEAPPEPIFNLKTAGEVLAALTPATSLEKLESGNDLLLEVPDVARSGEVPVHLVSIMPRTEGLWLLTLQPDGQAAGALLRKFRFGPHEPPEARTTVRLEATQTLLLVASANGRYFGVRREVKVGFDPGDERAR